MTTTGATPKKAPQGATCVVCLRGIRKGSWIEDYAGFWKHAKCSGFGGKDDVSAKR